MQSYSLLAAVALVLLATPAVAQKTEQPDEAESTAVGEHSTQSVAEDGPGAPQHKSGYEQKPPFGGPNAPSVQLEEDDRVKKPAFRFERFDRVMSSWFDWKKRVNKKHGIQLSGHYVAVYQGLDDSLTAEEAAGSGLLRFNSKWDLIGRESEDTGSIVITVDQRHGYTEVTPANIGGEVGYLGQSGMLLSDVGLVLVNLNWQQAFNDRRAGVIVGRFDPSDYMNVLGYANPWTTFQNLAILVDASVAFPDASFGVGGGSWIKERWYALGTVNDANGTLTEETDLFEGGAEFFSQVEVGWSPSKDVRYLKKANLTLWHVDERDDAGIEEAEGILFSANWTFKETWMPFVRAGWSDGSAPIYNRSVTLGAILKHHFRSDLSGLSINWGDPPDDSLDEQVTVEAFHRFQIAQNLAVTTSLQYLVDPALNPTDDEVWVVGLRVRTTF